MPPTKPPADTANLQLQLAALQRQIDQLTKQRDTLQKELDRQTVHQRAALGDNMARFASRLKLPR